MNVHTQSKGEVSIAAAIRCSADRQADAKSFCDQIRIQVDEGASGVTVRTDYPKNWRGTYGYSVNLDIAMPDTSPLDITNRFGDVTVQNLHAAAIIRNSNGKAARPLSSSPSTGLFSLPQLPRRASITPQFRARRLHRPAAAAGLADYSPDRSGSPPPHHAGCLQLDPFAAHWH